MDILFWSGGKDSYLALEFYRREHSKTNLKLLTTYREDIQRVPHQNIDIDDIKKQAETLGLELILVPLPKHCPNDKYLEKVKESLEGCREPVERLVFGDWKLQDIRDWREKEFGKMGYMCLFPIWQKSLHELLPVLMLKPVEVTISAVKNKYKKYIRAGEAYDQKFVSQLPEEIDPMGENGEFHTKVSIQTFNDIEQEKQPLY